MGDEKRSAPSPKEGLSGANFAGMGLQFAVAIIVFLFAGQWLDNRLGFSGLFSVLGVFVGAAAAFYNMYRKITAAQKQDDEERRIGRREAGSGRRER